MQNPGLMVPLNWSRKLGCTQHNTPQWRPDDQIISAMKKVNLACFESTTAAIQNDPKKKIQRIFRNYKGEYICNGMIIKQAGTKVKMDWTRSTQITESGSDEF